MAYDPDNLSLTDQIIGGVYRRYAYLTADDEATVSADDYFAGEELLQIGDRIEVVVVDSINPEDRTTGSGFTLVVASI